MKIGFDIGGVISKYPDRFKQLITMLGRNCYGSTFTKHLYIITDQHPKEQVLKTLEENGFGLPFWPENVYFSVYIFIRVGFNLNFA